MPSSSKHTRHSMPRLAEKTVEELRALAKSIGLTRYSKLTKSQLQRVIAAASPPAATRAASSKAATKTATKQKPARRAETPANAPRAQALARKAPPAAASKAKPVKATAALAPTTDAQDTAPALSGTSPHPSHHAPMLTLRGQKPGVLHAAWSIDPARSMPLPYLRLRLLKASPDDRGIIDEIPLPDLHGSRYFHLAAEFHDVPLRAEIGYHSSDGRFIVMQHYSDMRLPSRLAAGRGDPQWWISDMDFRELYLRSGGIAEGGALVWRTSYSSRSSSLTSSL
jgi:hypothetical protein